MSIDVSTPNSPGWWFNILALRMATRNAELDGLNAYLTGDAPLPEGAANIREAYQNFQRKARLNLAELVVGAPQERMTVFGFRVGDAKELSKEARRIWSYNELDTFAGDIHSEMLGLRDGYAIVGPPGPDGIPIITHEDPFLVIAEPDPLRPNRVRAALKMYRDEFAGVDTAYLYLPGEVYIAQRANQGPSAVSVPMVPNASGFDWVSGMRWPAGFEDVVPVVRWHNKGGVSEFEHHTDLLDRINLDILQRLVITAMQAYRQRAVKNGSRIPEVEMEADGATPKLDEAGNSIPVDIAAMLQPGPGALWVLPDGVELWESGVTDIQQLLSGSKDDLRDLAIATGTPMYMLMPEGANQTAAGASLADKLLVYKAEDRQLRAGYAWNQAMALALRFSGLATSVLDIETLWRPAERLSLAERADAASKAKDVPWRTKMTDIWGFSPAKVEEMETERLSDALVSFTAAPLSALPVEVPGQTPSRQMMTRGTQ